MKRLKFVQRGAKMKYNTGLSVKMVSFHYQGKVLHTAPVNLSYPAERKGVYEPGRTAPEKKVSKAFTLANGKRSVQKPEYSWNAAEAVRIFQDFAQKHRAILDGELNGRKVDLMMDNDRVFNSKLCQRNIKPLFRGVVRSL